MSGQACGCATQPCGCCEGVQQLTPANECNRPGLGAIKYRVGTHGQFLSGMKARLSTMVVDGVASDGQTVGNFRPLRGLTTRDANDFSIALLDGWATVGDVLSFYQERIANEGYLRTATERRSVLELSNLVGYTLRPGVAATVFLAYTIDDKQADPVTIPIGARSQSVPGPGEAPQSFETAEVLEARAAWNILGARTSRPQITADLLQNKQVYLTGINTQLKPVDPLLIDFGDGNLPAPFRVVRVEPDAANNRTLVTFAPWPSGGTGQAAALAATAAPAATSGAARSKLADPVIGLMQRLTLPPSVPPRNSVNLVRNLGATFIDGADIGTQVVGQLQPTVRDALGGALSQVPGSPLSMIKVYALRSKAGPFGNIAQQKITHTTPTLTTVEWARGDMFDTNVAAGAGEATDTVFLDGAYDKLTPDSWVLVDTSGVDWAGQHFVHQPVQGSVVVARARVANAAISRNAYGLTGKSTLLQLGDLSGNAVNWYEMVPAPVVVFAPASAPVASAAVFNPPDLTFQLIRRSAVYAQAEELSLAEAPITVDICRGGAHAWVELDGHYADLKSGRWVIVAGDRADVQTNDPLNQKAKVSISGVHASELLMLSNVIQDIAAPDGTPMSRVTDKAIQPLPGETRHTFIQFAKDLGFCYARDKVVIYGNVVKATHGETRKETLGSGDGSKGLQSFSLKQPPLTFVAAPTAVGADSTLHTYVNDVEWHETDSLAWLGPKDRGFVTTTDDSAYTTLTFGDGDHGARLPTGLLNVKAAYRNGIGRAGDVRAEQISLLQTRPLGVKAVINPIRASGGADKESRDLARENAPLSVMPLDRLVSVQDYADFTRRFAGIAKALAQRTTDNNRQVVYLTIAGVDDVPIDVASDPHRNLLDALYLLGDPDLPLRVDIRELKMLVLSAKIKIQPDYLWEPVVGEVRAQLLDAFGFAKRGLGQWALLSEVLSEIQGVRGVSYVDVDAFGAVPEKVPDTAIDGTPIRRSITPDEITAAVRFVVDPDSALRILRSRAAKDRLPKNVDAWPGGSDAGLLRPAELVIFTPEVPDTLILNQIP